MNIETNATNADLSPTTTLVRSYVKLMELQKVVDQLSPSSTTASTAEIEISSVITTPFTTVPLDDEPSLLESRAGTPAKAAHHSSSVVLKALMSLMELHTPIVISTILIFLVCFVVMITLLVLLYCRSPPSQFETPSRVPSLSLESALRESTLPPRPFSSITRQYSPLRNLDEYIPPSPRRGILDTSNYLPLAPSPSTRTTSTFGSNPKSSLRRSNSQPLHSSSNTPLPAVPAVIPPVINSYYSPLTPDPHYATPRPLSADNSKTPSPSDESHLSHSTDNGKSSLSTDDSKASFSADSKTPSMLIDDTGSITASVYGHGSTLDQISEADEEDWTESVQI